jgi:hypothetical protein
MRRLGSIGPYFLTAVFCLVAASLVHSQETVSIDNFPKKQIMQDVNSIPKTHMGRVERVKVPTTAIENIDLSAKYVVKTEGYRQATVSLIGQAKSVDVSRCRVGVVLLPNEAQVLAAWQNDKLLALSEEVTTGVNPGEKYFQGQIGIDIKFPSYLLGFYNTCNTAVEMNLYLYLK